MYKQKEIEELIKTKRKLQRSLEETKEQEMNLKSELKKINEKIRNPNNQNSVSQLIRVSNNFNDEIEDINNKREELGFDPLSKPKITELLVRHNNWIITPKEDIIHFNIEVEENRGIPNVIL